MTWNEFKDYIRPNKDLLPPARELTTIECPECGKQIYRRNDMVLTSYPPQYKYECDCGWTGYA